MENIPNIANIANLLHPRIHPETHLKRLPHPSTALTHINSIYIPVDMTSIGIQKLRKHPQEESTFRPQSLDKPAHTR